MIEHFRKKHDRLLGQKSEPTLEIAKRSKFQIPALEGLRLSFSACILPLALALLTIEKCGTLFWFQGNAA